jgi:hypothetical protein
LNDDETGYAPIEKLFLALYYECTKLWYYLLTSACVVVCQHNVVKYMLHKPILRGRLGKWAYTLVEYDLSYELLQSTKGQIVADFIVDHRVAGDGEECLVESHTWKLFFDGSVCSKECGIGCMLVSPLGTKFELSVRLEFTCTNNQAEYEALLHGLECLRGVGVQSVEVFWDSMLVVQQIMGESQCLDRTLNSYRDMFLDIVKTLEHF